jgi:hypothetical protein
MNSPIEDLHKASEAARAGGSLASLEALESSVVEAKARLDALAGATYRGADKTGQVAAEVSSAGEVQSVDVSGEVARDLSAEALGVACQAAITAARATLGRQVTEVAAALGSLGAVQKERAVSTAHLNPTGIAAELRRAAAGMA